AGSWLKLMAPVGVTLVLTSLAAAQDLTPPAQANPAPGCSVSRVQLVGGNPQVCDARRIGGPHRAFIAICGSIQVRDGVRGQGVNRNKAVIAAVATALA